MTKLYKAGIIGTGSVLPNKKLTNAYLESIVDTSDEWIIKRTGIRERRIISDDTLLTNLAAEASSKAISDAGLEVGDIDLIIATTVTADYLTPSLSCCVQNEIGAEKAAAFDMNAACTGFIYALETAQKFIATGTYTNILIVSAEALSRVVDFSDRKTCVLFGDGSGAAVVSRVEDDTGIESSILGATGSKGSVLTIPGFYSSDEDRSKRKSDRNHIIWMDGSEVFVFATRIMVQVANHVINDAGLTVDDIKYVFPHQANMRILQNASKRLKIPMDRIYSNLEYTGNISSASIPVCLDEASRKNMLNKGDKIVLVAFGGGLTYGATLMTWSK